MGKLNLFLVLTFAFIANLSTAQTNVPGDVPPNAVPGKCYAKCLISDEYESTTEQIETKAATTRTEVIPAEYETVTEQVLKSAESKRIITIPAEYESVTEQLMVKPETKRLIAVPATYETVTEQIMVRPESKRIITIPAEYETVTETYVMEAESSRYETLTPKYETVTERVETRPASTKWVKRKADRTCLSADPNDCLVWCLVDVPAEYKTITKRVNVGCDGTGVANSGCTKEIAIPAKMGTRTARVLKTPATTREEAIPAEFKTITKQVIKTPATTREEVIPAEFKTMTKQVIKTPATIREEVIPAEYATVSKRVVKTPARTNTINVPAEYSTVSKRNLVKKGGFTEWREVLCNNQVDDYTIRQIQDALRSKGYDPGPIDNILGVRTRAALTKYQKDNGLPVGSLDLETLKSLGVKF